MQQLSFTFEMPSALLTPDEIYQLSDNTDLLRRLKEGRHWERKPAGVHARALGEYFSMWANTAPSGGLIAIGIEDHGEMGQRPDPVCRSGAGSARQWLERQ